MNQKQGLNRFSKLPDDGDPWAPNNLLKLRKKAQVGKDQEKAQSEKDSHPKKPRREKNQINNQVPIP